MREEKTRKFRQHLSRGSCQLSPPATPSPNRSEHQERRRLRTWPARRPDARNSVHSSTLLLSASLPLPLCLARVVIVVLGPVIFCSSRIILFLFLLSSYYITLLLLTPFSYVTAPSEAPGHGHSKTPSAVSKGYSGSDTSERQILPHSRTRVLAGEGG